MHQRRSLLAEAGSDHNAEGLAEGHLGFAGLKGS
jgi:hypothetical protein